MSHQVQFIVVDGDNCDQLSLGVFDLDVIPRAGEYVFCDLEINDRNGAYKVIAVMHNVKPKGLIALTLASING